MAAPEMIEWYEKYAVTLKRFDHRHIIQTVVEVLKTTDTPENFVDRIAARVPYDKKLIRRVLHMAANRGFAERILADEIARLGRLDALCHTVRDILLSGTLSGTEVGEWLAKQITEIDNIESKV